LAVADQGSFAARTPQTFRERYGKPISETFFVRRDIGVSVGYGASGNSGDLAIIARRPNNIFVEPGSAAIDFQTLKGG
jgi:hypothetical protein